MKKKQKWATNPDTEFIKAIKESIIKLLEEKGILREIEIIKTISPKENRIVSDISVKRAIQFLFEENRIQKLKKEKLKEFGISEKDGRGTWIVLPKFIEKRRLIELLLNSLKSKNKVEVEMAWRELKELPIPSLNRENLDELIGLLKEIEIKQTSMLNFIINTLSNYLKLGILPSDFNVPVLKKTLYEKYKEINENIKETSEILVEIISLLSLLEDKNVLSIIEDFAEKKVLDKYIWFFGGNAEVSKIIHKYNSELYKLQLKFKNKREMAEAISQIRRDGEKTYATNRSNLSPSEIALGKVRG